MPPLTASELAAGRAPGLFIWSMPAVRVVGPLYALFPLNTSMPVPVLVTAVRPASQGTEGGLPVLWEELPAPRIVPENVPDPLATPRVITLEPMK